MASVISVKLSKAEKNGATVEKTQGNIEEFQRSFPDAAYDLTESIMERRVGPGILILTSSSQLLYKDRRAWDLCAEINKGAGKAANGVLPTPVVELCGEVNKLLQIWTDAKDWEQIRIKRVIGSPDQPILLSGLGLPDRHGLQQSRILITMEAIGRRQGAVIEQIKEIFRLTDREVTVVQNLLKGWTNKEIANELGVTEQTVKEHIKHIMAKTKTTTRTGILVQVLRL
ncbi:MAG TPA: helix-turn-helix transcriptional regulator [Nitrospirales bacterium]|jgi:DNA-binding CsgD family transcriptional regulator